MEVTCETLWGKKILSKTRERAERVSEVSEPKFDNRGDVRDLVGEINPWNNNASLIDEPHSSFPSPKQRGKPLEMQAGARPQMTETSGRGRSSGLLDGTWGTTYNPKVIDY